MTLVVASAVPPLGALPMIMTLAGFFLGCTSPSRDMLVRSAPLPGASGKVYGFVNSDLDLGSAMTPRFYGWLLGRGPSRLVLTIATVLQVRPNSLSLDSPGTRVTSRVLRVTCDTGNFLDRP